MEKNKLNSTNNPPATQSLLIKAGAACWLLLVGIVVALYVLHQNGVINAWQFPLKPLGAFLGGGGLACFLVGMLSRRHYSKRLIWVALIAAIAINAIAYLGAYTATHLRSPGQLGFGMVKLSDSRLPSDVGLDYVRHQIPVSPTEWLESWLIPTQQPSKGTVLLFPGNGGSKARQLLAPAQVFKALDYDSLLVDFQGLGGSTGNVTTLGIREADDVVLAVNYAEQLNLQHPIVLYGVSMGSAAILKAVAQKKIAPDAIILELPFTELISAVKSRLRAFNVPAFPTAELLVFWASLQHGVNGFAHNPVHYAEQVNCATLILQGDQDRWITMDEIDRLFQNLPDPKHLAIFPNAGHQLLVTVDKEHWQQSIEQFLNAI